MSWLIDADRAGLWRMSYDRAYKAFVRGALTEKEASDRLVELRYKGEALRIELTIWIGARQRRKRDAYYSATKKLMIHEQTQNGETAPCQEKDRPEESLSSTTQTTGEGEG
jgi:hypothetical protein